MAKLTADDITIERLLGEGNMSKVYEARINRTNEPVALKLIEKERMKRLQKDLEVLMEKHCLISLNPQAYRDAGTSSAFPQSVAVNLVPLEPSTRVGISPTFHHGSNHICQLYHTFATDFEIGLILELCEGQELWDAIKNMGVCNWNKLKAFWVQVEKAVEAMHKKQIVHRDIKAENIVMKRNGKLKFMDFGTAYDLTLPYETTVAGTRGRGPRSKSALHFYVGTPNFMGPECRRNQAVRDTRIDIWSLGCLLYQIATGAPPFQAPSEFLVYVRAQNHDLDIPCYLRPEITAYINACLKDDVVSRPHIESLRHKSITQGVNCCADLSPGVGDTNLIMVILRRRINFYADLIAQFVRDRHVELKSDSHVCAQECQGGCTRGPTPNGKIPIDPLNRPDCAWLKNMYPWLDEPTILVKGEACARMKNLIDSYVLSPGTQVWCECWTRLRTAVESETKSHEVELDTVSRIRDASSSGQVSGLLTGQYGMARDALDCYVRTAFHALRILSTNDRNDDLYEQWAKQWSVPGG